MITSTFSTFESAVKNALESSGVATVAVTLNPRQFQIVEDGETPINKTHTIEADTFDDELEIELYNYLVGGGAPCLDSTQFFAARLRSNRYHISSIVLCDNDFDCIRICDDGKTLAIYGYIETSNWTTDTPTFMCEHGNYADELAASVAILRYSRPEYSEIYPIPLSRDFKFILEDGESVYRWLDFPYEDGGKSWDDLSDADLILLADLEDEDGVKVMR